MIIDGALKCDKCEGDLGYGGPDVCGRFTYLKSDGTMGSHVWCTRADTEKGTLGCVPRTVLSATNLKSYRVRFPEESQAVFDPSQGVTDGT